MITNLYDAATARSDAEFNLRAGVGSIEDVTARVDLNDAVNDAVTQIAKMADLGRMGTYVYIRTLLNGAGVDALITELERRNFHLITISTKSAPDDPAYTLIEINLMW